MKKIKTIIFFSLISLTFSSCAQTDKKNNSKTIDMKENITTEPGKAIATFGAGCFWCVEAVFQQLEGVEKVVSGYSGGKIKNPTYKEVCSGLTGHAEVIQITYDTTKVNYETLLEAFWSSHDPTTMNRQGADVGSQYRSVIFYHDDQQKKLAEEYKAKLNASGAFEKPVVTEISSFESFYKAEDSHQNYYNQNKDAPYCSYVITPKLEKFKKVFEGKLKK